jgi:hypothetical protein
MLLHIQLEQSIYLKTLAYIDLQARNHRPANQRHRLLKYFLQSQSPIQAFAKLPLHRCQFEKNQPLHEELSGQFLQSAPLSDTLSRHSLVSSNL